MSIRRLFAAAIASLAIPALATPQHKLATGLWIDPNESGWGLNLFHQGNTVFGSLFVYGPDGQPRWYTASEMINTDDGPLHDHPTIVSGDLSESTGPWFGAARFDPGAVTRRKVGTMSIDLGNTLSGVSYTIDGVTVAKNIVPFTFRAENLAGSYIGRVFDPTTKASDELSINVTDNGSSIVMNTTSTANGSCTYSGTRSQSRGETRANGTFSCGNGRSGTFGLAVDITPDGFVGRMLGFVPGPNASRIAASRTGPPEFQGNGWRSDLWFPTNEGGWGVNIIEQGDTIFATLFVYDPQGRPRWYSASDLHRIGPDAATGQYLYIGPLQESTGPYFGTAFNPAAVTRRVVGQMEFEAHLDGTGVLHYAVDGVVVHKSVKRFSFRKNMMTGTYAGNRTTPFGVSEPLTIVIDDDFPATRITTTSPSATCVYTGLPPVQLGEQRVLSGASSCAGQIGEFTMSNVNVTWDGFTASFTGNGISGGHMVGARRELN